jgi:retinol dehydrogenase-12
MTTEPRAPVMIVTGGNSGIGLETARHFARNGARVIITARDRKKGESAKSELRRSTGNAAIDLAVFDLASLASVREGAREILERASRIDVLVNNAGLVLQHRQTTVDGFEATFAINHLGPFLLTNLLLERIRASGPARIVNVSSRAHTRCFGLRFDDLMFERRRYFGMGVYSHSKLANISFTVELAKRLAGTSVTTNALHPGIVQTGFGKDGDLGGIFGLGWRLIGPFLLTAEQGARTSIHCATAPELERVTGKYFDKCKEKRPNRAARDEKAAARLWTVSEKLVGLA